MSEVNLEVLAKTENEAIESKAFTPMQEISLALKSCTFGKFHIRLLFSSFIGIMSGVLITSTTAFLLTVAECDLEMDLLHKGILNAMPYVGMMFSSVVGGFLTDVFGRKKFLVGGYFGLFCSTVWSSLSQTYVFLTIGKFFEGLFFAVSFNPTVTLTSEFIHNEIRDRMMLCQSSFAAVTQILASAMALGILTNNWKFAFFEGRYVLNTWNIYLLMMSSWSLLACILYIILPESPKYLLTQGKYDESREILVKIYMENTGKDADSYPFSDLWKNRKSHEKDVDSNSNTKVSFLGHLKVGLNDVKPIFKKPLGTYLMIICSMNIIIMSLFNVFRLWFPQLSTIIEYSDMRGQDLCDTLDAYTLSIRTKPIFNDTLSDVCIPKTSSAQTYIQNMVIGLVCVLPYLVTGALVNRVGKKILIFCIGVICVFVCIGLRWTNEKWLIVGLFALVIASCQCCLSLLQALTVETFGTATRTLSLSIVMMVGRIGVLSGNISFPILLNMGCEIPFFLYASLMIYVTLMSTILPAKKKK